MPVITRAELRTLVIARAVEAGCHSSGPAFFESIEAEVDRLVLLGDSSANLDQLWQELVTLRQHNVAKGCTPYSAWRATAPLIPEAAVDASYDALPSSGTGLTSSSMGEGGVSGQAAHVALEGRRSPVDPLAEVFAQEGGKPDEGADSPGHPPGAGAFPSQIPSDPSQKGAA
jgi:hypothetical protein